MTIFINRSIPLSQESRDGWTNAGAVVLSRSTRRCQRQLDGVGRVEQTVVNLGLGRIIPDVDRIYNDHLSIRALLTPAALRRTIPDLIPPSPRNGDTAWWKGPGQHGENKRRIVWADGGQLMPREHPGFDLQTHIEGDEYRVITVGTTVVQAHRKTGSMPDFVWTWVGVKGISPLGIIPLCKNAVALVPSGERTVIGWDIILRTARPRQPFIIEANSSPGVNDATARRIVEQIRRIG